MNLRYITPLLLTIFIVSSVLGQETQNPFDLQDKLEVETSIIESPRPSSDNPFDIQNSASQSSWEESNESTTSSPLSIEAKNGNEISLAVLLLIPLALLLTLFRGVFNNFFESVYRDRKFNQFYRRMNSIWVIPHILLYAYFFLSVAIFVHLVLSYYGYEVLDTWRSIAFITTSLASFILAKHAMIFFVGDTFDVKNEYTRYALLFMTFNITIGVLLTPINLLLLLGPSSIKSAVIIIAFILLGLTILLLILRSLSVANKLLLQHPLHFFTYLCTIEIAPLFIIAKMIT